MYTPFELAWFRKPLHWTALWAVLAIALSACGMAFNDEHAVVTISAPEGSKVYLDGMLQPSSRSVRITSHKEHAISAIDKDGVNLGVCTIGTEVQVKYAVGDALLFTTLVPLILDFATNDWSSPDKTFCDFTVK